MYILIFVIGIILSHISSDITSLYPGPAFGLHVLATGLMLYGGYFEGRRDALLEVKQLIEDEKNGNR